jgi:nitric oxide reductase subunit B
MGFFRWMRIVGDTIFAAGAFALGWFVLGIRTGWSFRNEPDAVAVRFHLDGSSAEATIGSEPHEIINT